MRSAIAAILPAGLVAGVLDLTEVSIYYAFRGVSPVRILQAIASGLLGAEAFQGGWAAASLGFVLHFVIATGAAATYYAASRRFSVLIARPVLCGLAFGLAVYVFMNHGIVPLSRTASAPFDWARFTNSLFAHLFCVGLPIALMIRHRA